MIATTATRVSSNTCPETNEEIRDWTDRSVAKAAAGGLHAIERRLAELDEEWDIERCIETMAPSFSLLGMLMGATVNRKWFLFPAVVQTFLLQHALQGWCPPVSVLRALGVRTAEEIHEERYALKALRGDFRGVGGKSEEALLSQGEAALSATRK